MSYDLVIKGGEVVTSHERYAADVAVQGDRIAAVGTELRGRREVDASGAYVLPGAIDGHVHMQTDRPYDRYDDTFETGTTAAAFGGVTTILDQAQVEPGQTLEDGLNSRLAEANGRSVIDYGFHVNLREPERARLEEIPGLIARGFHRFKFFMFYEGYALPDEVIFAAMQQVGRHGGLAIVHAENQPVILELMRQNAAAERHGAAWNARARPPIIEGEATHRALAMARVAGAEVLIFHMTTEDGVRELKAARERGQAAYGEVCPQYLLLGEEAWDDPISGSALDFSPPLRSSVHRDALWDALGSGTVDVVSTDHGPRRRVRDKDGQEHTPPGTSGIEVRLALVYSEGVRSGKLSLHRWVDACCSRPARIFGLPRKGRLRPGYDADLVVFDPYRRVTFSADILHSAIDHSTYDGVTVTGFPRTTISRGEVLVEDGELACEPNRGRLLLSSTGTG